MDVKEITAQVSARFGYGPTDADFDSLTEDGFVEVRGAEISDSPDAVDMAITMLQAGGINFATKPAWNVVAGDGGLDLVVGLTKNEPPFEQPRTPAEQAA